MLKTNLSDIFSDLNSESSVILPKSIKIKNINSVDTVANTTSSFMPQKEDYSDATSSFMPQKGGYLDATSSFMPQKGGYLNGTKNKDINQLISMLSATSDDNYTANSTDNTEQLKNKLFNIIQSGGGDIEYFKKHIDMIFNGKSLTIDDNEYETKYKELNYTDKETLQTYYREKNNHKKEPGLLPGSLLKQVIQYGLRFLDNEYPKIGSFSKPQPLQYTPPTDDEYASNIIDIMVVAYDDEQFDDLKNEYKFADDVIKTIIKDKLRSYSKDNSISNYQIYSKILKIIEDN